MGEGNFIFLNEGWHARQKMEREENKERQKNGSKGTDVFILSRRQLRYW